VALQKVDKRIVAEISKGIRKPEFSSPGKKRLHHWVKE
jgi:hypothetical protein